jgi:hypothetical protein
MPFPAALRLALTAWTRPDRPHRTSPYHDSHALPHRCTPHLSAPSPARTARTRPVVPHRALPYRDQPEQPRRAGPLQAGPRPAGTAAPYPAPTSPAMTLRPRHTEPRTTATRLAMTARPDLVTPARANPSRDGFTLSKISRIDSLAEPGTAGPERNSPSPDSQSKPRQPEHATACLTTPNPDSLRLAKPRQPCLANTATTRRADP